MIKTNKNEKAIKLAFSLNSLINKIENNIEIIDEVSYTKLVSKFENMFKKKEDNCKNTDIYRFFLSGIYSSLNLVLSNGTFEIIDSIEQLSEENFRDYILIKNICQKGKQSCSDSVKVEMKSQLNNLFFTEEGRLHIKEVCNNCINVIIDLYAGRNLTALAYNNQIPYSIASNEQKIYYWLAKYIPDELIYYITEYYLNNYDLSNVTLLFSEDIEVVSENRAKSIMLINYELETMYFDIVWVKYNSEWKIESINPE